MVGGMSGGSHEYDLFAMLTRTSTECLTLGQISGLSLSVAVKCRLKLRCPSAWPTVGAAGVTVEMKSGSAVLTASSPPWIGSEKSDMVKSSLLSLESFTASLMSLNGLVSASPISVVPCDSSSLSLVNLALSVCTAPVAGL